MIDRRHVQWTPDMDRTLMEMRRDRIGVRRCAERIGVAPCTAAKRIDRLALPRLPVGRHAPVSREAQP